MNLWSFGNKAIDVLAALLSISTRLCNGEVFNWTLISDMIITFSQRKGITRVNYLKAI
jgi:hypothetical protein